MKNCYFAASSCGDDSLSLFAEKRRKRREPQINRNIGSGEKL